MAETTGIAWTDSTFNPWIGCTRVSPGCDHCYAEAWDRRFAVSGHAMHWGIGKPRQRTSASNWQQPLRWERGHVEFMREHGRRRRVFCASLADVFDNEVPIAWFVDLMELVRATPNLDWLMLTKRIGNWSSRISEAVCYLDEQTPASYPLPLRRWLVSWLDGDEAPGNVWLGISVVNQTEADRDIPKLLAVPARVRFLSVEPMLGPIELRQRGYFHYCEQHDRTGFIDGTQVLRPPLDWIIVGGESGPHARAMPVEGARSLRDQCAAAGVPFFFKQMGGYGPDKGGCLLDGHVSM